MVAACIRRAMFNPYARGFRMSLQSRLSTLEHRHALLEDRIADEDGRPAPNPQSLDQLKREKLKLKDEMERMRGTLS